MTYFACIPRMALRVGGLLMQALAKYAFGLGTITVLASTVVFSLFSLPPGHGIGTEILVRVCDARPAPSCCKQFCCF